MPRIFIEYAFRERVAALRSMLEGGLGQSALIGFTRHNPAIITCGLAGPNGSIKGIGFIHKPGYLQGTLDKLREELKRPYDVRRAARFLLEEIYLEDLVDFSRLTTLEIAKGHTCENVRVNPKATILFFTPPVTSYEVRRSVEIHQSGPVWEFVNAVHDVFHRPRARRDWGRTPAYLFGIEEIYDNGEEAMGRLKLGLVFGVGVPMRQLC